MAHKQVGQWPTNKLQNDSQTIERMTYKHGKKLPINNLKTGPQTNKRMTHKQVVK